MKQQQLLLSFIIIMMMRPSLLSREKERKVGDRDDSTLEASFSTLLKLHSQSCFFLFLQSLKNNLLIKEKRKK